MKKILHTFVILSFFIIGMNHIKAISPVIDTESDEYGIYCGYGDYFFSYYGNDRHTYFDLEDNFGDELGIAIAVGRPELGLDDVKQDENGKYHKETDWLKNNGLLDNNFKFTCPSNPFGTNLGEPTEAICLNSCSMFDIPTGYSKFSCNYGNVSGEKLTINYEANATYPNGKYDITYPDGTTSTITKLPMGTILPVDASDCGSIYYVPSTKQIQKAAFINSNPCGNTYQSNKKEIKYFCSSGPDTCVEPELTCDEKSTELSVCGIEDIPRALPIFSSNIVKLVKIFVPILLIIMGMIDFVRAVIANDEKQMKEAQSRFIRRLLAGGFIFFVVSIVQFLFGAINTENNLFSCAADCFINGGDCVIKEDKINACLASSNTRCKSQCEANEGDYNKCYNACYRPKEIECKGLTGCEALASKDTCEADKGCLWSDIEYACKIDNCENKCTENVKRWELQV